MTTTQHFTEEPADGTILANDGITDVFVRDDAHAIGPNRWHTDSDGGTRDEQHPWSALAGSPWQRLYRQSDVDALLAAQREQIAQAIEAQDPVEAALAGQHAWHEAAKVARTLTPEEGSSTLVGHEPSCSAPNVVDTTRPGDFAGHAECTNCGVTWTIYQPKGVAR